MRKLVALVVLGLSVTAAQKSSGQSLKRIGLIELPGPKGQRFDYLTMDDEDH